MSQDGTRIVSGAVDATFKFWNAVKGQDHRARMWHTAQVSSVAVSRDNKLIVSASGGHDNSLKVWEAATGRLVWTVKGLLGPIVSLAVSPDGTRIFSGCGDKLKVWDAATGRQLLDIQGYTNTLALSPDGKRIVGGSRHNLKIWDTATGRELQTLEGHTKDVSSVALTSDGNQIVSAGEDGALMVWDALTGKRVFTFKRDHWILSVAVSRDGKRIAYGDMSKTIRICAADTGEQLQTLPGYGWWLAMSPDGQRIFSAEKEPMLNVWDAATGHKTLTLDGHEHLNFNAMALSSDGTRLVTGSTDGTVKIWDAHMRNR
jgi:WD40 repeat protein